MASQFADGARLLGTLANRQRDKRCDAALSCERGEVNGTIARAEASQAVAGQPTTIFRQLFEPVSSTYTCLLACETTGQAMLIDPVVNAIDRDLHMLQSLRLTLALTLDTHIHADHITAALHLKQRLGSRIAAPAIDRLPCVDVGIEEGTPLQLGGITVDPLHTPGHTDGHFAYRCDDRLFSGDAPC